MILTLTSSAITAAINSSWEEAVELNNRILEEEPKDIGALNRIAYAYMELGKPIKAQKYYSQVLILDPFNSIALKNIKKLKDADSFGPRQNITKNNSLALIFLEEPGKTKIVNGVKLTSKSLLCCLRTGDCLKLKPRKHSIALNDHDNNYIASLPDDLSFRILDFIKKGNKYEAYVKSVTKNSLLIFIRETHRSNKMKNVASFCQKQDLGRNKGFKKIREDERLETGKIETADEKEEPAD